MINYLFCQDAEISFSPDSGHRMDAFLFAATSVVTAPILAWHTWSLGMCLSPLWHLAKMETRQSIQQVHKVLNSVKEHEELMQPEINSPQSKFTLVPF